MFIIFIKFMLIDLNFIIHYIPIIEYFHFADEYLIKKLLPDKSIRKR